MAMESKERTKAVELAVSQIERQFGKGSIMKLGDRQIVDIPVIPTTSLSVDYALGVGGIPRGRVTEIFGPESSGKTTFALHVIAEAQRMGGLAAFIDAVVAEDALLMRTEHAALKRVLLHHYREPLELALAG